MNAAILIIVLATGTTQIPAMSIDECNKTAGHLRGQGVVAACVKVATE